MRNGFKINRFSVLAALIISVMLSFGAVKHRLAQLPVHTIAWDVYGYYLYLPSTFIYHDPGLQKTEWLENTFAKYKPSPDRYQYHSGIKGRQINVYPMGLAWAYAPGFFLAHLYALATGAPADGFSAPYEWSVVFTSILFLVLGVFLLRKILLYFFSDKLTAILIALSVLGTNYLFQVTFDGAMPHNFMFVLNCLIIWYTIQWHQHFKVKHAVLLAFFIGWATISRPTEIIWLLLPVLWGIKDKVTLHQKMAFLKKHFRQVLIFALVLILTGFPQLLYWKWTSGHWLSYNHDEGFSFSDPYTIQFLFSYKKGWLLYTPLMIFAIAGFYSLYKNRKEIFYACFVFFLVNLYLLSSWDCWWYGASFGQRPMVESYPLMAIPLGYFLIAIWRRGVIVRTLAALSLICCLLLNLFQTWQMLTWMMDSERMSKAYYWKIFGKTYVGPEERKLLEFEPTLGNNDVVFKGNEHDFYRKEIFYMDLETNLEGADPGHIADTLGFESRHSLRMDSTCEFSPGIESRYDDLSNKDYLWVMASVEVYPLTTCDVGNSCLVISVETKGRINKYKAFTLCGIKPLPGRWNKLTASFLTPYIRHGDDKLKVYYWNTGKKTLYIDNLKVDVLEPKVKN
jgi:hypothetical protein